MALLSRAHISWFSPKSDMLHELLPVPRALVSMDMLPDRIKWQHAENIMGLEAGRTFTARERGSGRSVLGKCMGAELLYTYLGSIPNFSATPTPHDTPNNEWRVPCPVWRSAERQVDMHPTVDLGYMDSRYVETCVGAPIALFVKGTLLRSRMTTGFHDKIRTLLRTPQELAESHATKCFPLNGHTEAFLERIDGKQGEILDRDIAELKQTETQLQIVLYLEVLDHDETADGLVDAHFDRLLLWQTLSDCRQDMVLEFCMQVIWPFYRSTHRKKAEQLYFRAKGKRERITREQKKRKEEAAQEDTRVIQRSVSLLERARSLRFSASTPQQPQPENHAIRKTSLLKPNKHTLRREIEVSFKSKPTSRNNTSQPSSQPPAKRIHTGRGAREATYTPTIHVYATPVASRRVVLKKEQIDLPDLEIESTDEDE